MHAECSDGIGIFGIGCRIGKDLCRAGEVKDVGVVVEEDGYLVDLLGGWRGHYGGQN